VKVLLIVNSSASSVTARARVVIQRTLAAEHELAVAETSRRGHAARLAQGAAADGVDVVAVLGGDGTLNEAANGLARTRTALGVLPGGSTNVYARTIGMVNDPIDATQQLLASLAAGSIRPVSLGYVNGRYFLFHVGLGFDAAVVAAVERRSIFKRYLGAAVFLAATVSTWARRYDRSTPWFAVRAAGVGIDDGYFAICLKTNPYTFLGNRPVDIAPGTGFDTGLSLVTFRSLDLRTLLSLTTAALHPSADPSRDPFAGRRKVRLDRDLDSVEVTAYRPLPYQVDGDHLGDAEHFELRCESEALRLVVPTPSSDQRHSGAEFNPAEGG
jgi:diacylglycerol kinase family enzyme